MLTVDDLNQLFAVPEQTIRNWISLGIVTPAAPGGGRGREHRFTATQALGVAVAEFVRKSPQSCAMSYVTMIVDAFGRLTEAQIRKQLKSKAHAFAFVVGTGGGPHIVWERPDQYGGRVDARPLWAAVLDRLTERANEPVVIGER